MRNIIIVGGAGTGKTELARLISETRDALWVLNREDLRNLTKKTECIVFDAISSERDWTLFKQLASTATLSIRPFYSVDEVKFNLTDVLLIGLTQSFNEEDSRKSFVYRLS